MGGTMILASSLSVFAPRPRIRMLDWCLANITMPDGRPYDHLAYPHFGAPGGPCEAIDDPAVVEINLQFASRLGKTAFAHAALMFFAANNPGPAMFASATEKLACEVVATKVYPMLDHCKPLAGQLRAEHRRKRDRVDLRFCRIFVAWARSPSTLADKAVKYAHANEIDKWEHETTSKEGDPLKLLDERGKEFPTRKFIRESTPAIKNRSRIEHALQNSTNCRYFVPCPLCGHYQKLRLGTEGPPGLVWDHAADGHSDRDLAFHSARYVCEGCTQELKDEHRAPMLRAGRWVPEGCTINPDGTLAGSPVRDGRRVGYQLSSLYALSLGWGDIAQEFVSSKGKSSYLRNFVNGWLGETWEPHRTKTTAEQLADRIGGKVKRGLVPHGGLFLSVGIDKQGAEGGYHPYVVTAWGEDERCWLVQYGVSETFDELKRDVLTVNYFHEDGGIAMRPAIVLLDSGFDTKAVYDFCAQNPGVLPCKGQDAQGTEPYRVVRLGMDSAKTTRATQRGHHGQILIHVNTDFWESELQCRLEDRKAGEPGSLQLCEGGATDWELLDQLLNGAMEDIADRRGNAKLLWVKKDPTYPNDFRDAMRYAMCGARAFLDDRGGRMPARQQGVGGATKTVINPGHSRPDGRQWVTRR